MRELDSIDLTIVSGGMLKAPGITMPPNCLLGSMLSSAGYGALTGITGFAGGPVAGATAVLFGASLGGIIQLNACVRDLRAM